MLCENCKNNEATVHLTQIVNGKKQQLKICESCAKEFNDFNSNFSFQNLLSGLMDYMIPTQHTKKTSELICKSCGTTYNDFKKYGLLGCSDCYESFMTAITPIIKRVQGNIEHTGKIPKKMGKEIIEKRRLIKLKEDLQKAIASEDYERAAEIRDLIKSFQTGE